MARYFLEPGKDRKHFSLEAHGFPEVGLIGIHHQSFATTGLREHVHAGALEISYLVKGERVYTVGGQDYPFKGGEIFVTFPDEKHGSGTHPHSKALLYWMQLRLPASPKPFLALTAEAAWPLVSALRALPRRLFRVEPGLKRRFERIFSLALLPPAQMLHLEIAVLLTEWLIVMLRCSERAANPAASADIQKAVHLIEQHVRQGLTVDELAEAVHLSESRFKAKFKEQMGVPPAEFIQRKKIELAQRLLRARACSVTTLAHQLGFSSSQYFATVFKRFTHQSPKDWRGAARLSQAP